MRQWSDQQKVEDVVQKVSDVERNFSCFDHDLWFVDRTVKL